MKDVDTRKYRSRATNFLWGFILLVAVSGIGIVAYSYLYSNKKESNNHSNTIVSSINLPSVTTNAVQVAVEEEEEEEEDVAKKEHFYHHQIIDHLNPTKTYNGTTTYTQRYYENSNYFGGPGSPIFVIMGGEDPLDGLLYPFVYNHLAQTYRGHTVAIEHRFFGKSIPLSLGENTFPDHTDLHQLLTPNQAILDAVHFVQYKRRELGCHLHRGHPDYCPVISVGGSYPGFLAAVLRMVHSDIIDIGYGSSAPFRLYSHHTDQYAYYDKVTTTAETASPGCADAVRTTLYDAQEDIIESLNEQLEDVGVTYGICRGSIPSYIQTTTMLAQELMLIIATHFANGNMNYYPPTEQQDFVKGCHIFQNTNTHYKSTEQKIKAYLLMDNDNNDDLNGTNTTTDTNIDCFDMMTELPPGPKGTISSSDWSGVGAGPEGYYWDYISCQLIPMCGFSTESMFPPRDWNYTWVIEHCMDRFDWYPDLWTLQEEFHFDDLSQVTRLMLTNGIVDGWSISSILDETVAPGVKVINMVNVRT
jgi:Serine carboxypeptidase S28